MSDDVRKLREILVNVVDFAYEQGYHEHGVPLVAVFEEAIRGDGTPGPARADPFEAGMEAYRAFQARYCFGLLDETGAVVAKVAGEILSAVSAAARAPGKGRMSETPELPKDYDLGAVIDEWTGDGTPGSAREGARPWEVGDQVVRWVDLLSDMPPDPRLLGDLALAVQGAMDNVTRRERFQEGLKHLVAGWISLWDGRATFGSPAHAAPFLASDSGGPREEIASLKIALVTALIPLECIIADEASELGPIKEIGPDLRKTIHSAVALGRATISGR